MISQRPRIRNLRGFCRISPTAMLCFPFGCDCTSLGFAGILGLINRSTSSAAACLVHSSNFLRQFLRPDASYFLAAWDYNAASPRFSNGLVLAIAATISCMISPPARLDARPPIISPFLGYSPAVSQGPSFASMMSDFRSLTITRVGKFDSARLSLLFSSSFFPFSVNPPLRPPPCGSVNATVIKANDNHSGVGIFRLWQCFCSANFLPLHHGDGGISHCGPVRSPRLEYVVGAPRRSCILGRWGTMRTSLPPSDFTSTSLRHIHNPVFAAHDRRANR